LILQNVSQGFETDKNDFCNSSSPLHMFHQNQGRDLQMVRVVGPVLGSHSSRAGEVGVTHVMKVHLFD
jgi:hypothetical protein